MHPLQAIDYVMSKLHMELENRKADGSGQVENLCTLLLKAAQQKMEVLRLVNKRNWKIKYGT